MIVNTYYMSFKNPITYCPQVKELNESSIKDLEINKLYANLLDEESDTTVRKMWVNQYTTNIEFLKNTQELLQVCEKLKGRNTKDIEELWKNYTENKGFREKYEYITFDRFFQLNKYESILQAISMYTLASPVLSLISPFLMLLIPFFIIRIKGGSITLPKYIEVLKTVMSKLPIGQIFNLSSASWDQRIFMIFSIFFYFFQMYQNSVTCYKFYRNSNEMYETLNEFSKFGRETITDMDLFSRLVNENELTAYEPFIKTMSIFRNKLSGMCVSFEKLKSGALKQMGMKMKYFYEIYCDEEIQETLNYAIHFHEYIRNIRSLSTISEIKCCKFSTKKMSLCEQFYAPLREKSPSPVRNTLKMKTSSIISGPNASGKTTIIKSTLFNIIISQQIGMGFYKSAYIIPQHHFHCYINIPDTNDRDSLFQAEARKCRDILTSLERYPNDNHFCVFDELFSGTNPYEAVASATAYLQYLHKNYGKNVKYMLTTHYIDLCKNLDHTYGTNYTMATRYTLNKGISLIKGGIKVLEEQDFPNEIIDKAKMLIS